MNIREICEKHKISQSGLARRFGIPLRTVQGWYLGERKPPEYVVSMIGELLALDPLMSDERVGELLAEGLQRKVERRKIVDQTQYRPDPDDEAYDYSQHLRPDELYQLTKDGPMMTEAELLEHFKAEYRAKCPGDPVFIAELEAIAAVEQVKRDRACIRMRAEQIREQRAARQKMIREKDK